MVRHPQVLITGAGGQVGTALRDFLPEGRFATRADLDVTDAVSLREAAEGMQAIVHLAANTDVDGCEAHPEDARLVNSIGTKNVVEAARGSGARVIYVSTDFVFRGDLEHEYSEDDETGPLNVYGTTKLEGEHHLDPTIDLTVRSSWIFGAGRNFIATILLLARQGPLRVIHDQRGRPTSATELARSLAFLLGTELAGTIHVAGDGKPTTWAELARTAVTAAELDAEVIEIDTATYGAEANRLVAPRPPNSALALDMARRLGVPLLDWQTSVTNYVGTII